MHTRQNAITGLLSNAINDETSGKTAILYECKKSHRLTPEGWATIAQVPVSHRWLHTQYTRFRFKCQAI